MRAKIRWIVSVLVLVAGVAVLFARGGSETVTAEDSNAEPSALVEMRRLTGIGAGLKTRGGSLVPVELPAEYQNQPAPGGHSQFTTDFSRALISYSDVVAGGPPKDGIPSIDNPQFVSIADADAWLDAREAVIVVTVGTETHLYPLQILMWHEIVNDTVGGVPLTVTYCPLCNTGIVFQRTFNDQVLDFGVSGRLVYSNMIMYDRRNETWWIQATGRGIAGKYAGQQLAFAPSLLLSWGEATGTFPDARVLSRDTGHRRDYGRNPYAGYDGAAVPFLYYGPDVIEEANEEAMTRVLSVYHGDGVVAFDFPTLEQQRVVERVIDGAAIVVFWESGTASALDSARVSTGRDVGTANAFYPKVDGRPLSFRLEGDRIIDSRTGSVWSSSGRAVAGELAGHRLEPALSIHHFLFSWRAFHPSSQR